MTKVMLCISGSKSDGDNENDIVELITQGVYYQDGKAHILQYEESALSGMEGTRTTLRIEDGSVMMEREGNFNSQFMFKNGQFFQGNYSTPYGDIQVGMYPIYMDYAFSNNSGHVELEYRLELAGVETMNQISIQFPAETQGAITARN